MHDIGPLAMGPGAISAEKVLPVTAPLSEQRLPYLLAEGGVPVVRFGV